MSTIRAELTNPDNVQLDLTITATLAEWKALRTLIRTHKDDPIVAGEYGGTREPFWALIYRLGDVLAAVERQHTSYE